MLIIYMITMVVSIIDETGHFIFERNSSGIVDGTERNFKYSLKTTFYPANNEVIGEFSYVGDFDSIYSDMINTFGANPLIDNSSVANLNINNLGYIKQEHKSDNHIQDESHPNDSTPSAMEIEYSTDISNIISRCAQITSDDVMVYVLNKKDQEILKCVGMLNINECTIYCVSFDSEIAKNLLSLVSPRSFTDETSLIFLNDEYLCTLDEFNKSIKSK